MKKDEPKTMPPVANFGCAGFFILIAIVFLAVFTDSDVAEKDPSTARYMIITAVGLLSLAVYLIISGRNSQKEIRKNIQKESEEVPEAEEGEGEMEAPEISPEELKKMIKETQENAKKRFKSQNAALTFAKENSELIIRVITTLSIDYRKHDHLLKRESKVILNSSRAMTVCAIGFQSSGDIRDCLIVLGLADEGNALVENVEKLFLDKISDFKTSNEAIEELKKWKEKLDLQLISQEDYEKKKSKLSKFIS